MLENHKKYLSYIMISLFAVAICCSHIKLAVASNSAGTKADNDYYLEEDLTKNSGLKIAGATKFNNQNQMVVYDLGASTPRYLILDTRGNPVSEIHGDFSGYGKVFALDKQDNLYVIVQPELIQTKDNIKAAASLEILTFNTSGVKLKKMELQLTDTNCLDLAIGSSGNFYILSFSGVNVFDKNGHFKTRFPGRFDFMDLDEQENLLLARRLDNGTNSLEKIDPRSGRSLWAHGLNQRIICGRYNRSNQAVYLVDGQKVYKFDLKKQTIYSVLGLEEHAIMNFETSVANINLDNTGNIYLTSSKTGKINTAYIEGKNPNTLAGAEQLAWIYRYSVTAKPKLPKNTKELTLSVMKSDRFLETSAVQFHNSHPTITIKVKEYLTIDKDSPNAADIEKFLKTINTEIMTGKAADLISLEGLPYSKYIEKRLLVNLSGVINRDRNFDLHEYNPKIIEACKYKGSLFFLPFSYEFQALLANRNMLGQAGIKINETAWTWDDFMQVALKLNKAHNADGTPQQYILPSMDIASLFQEIWGCRSNQFVDFTNKKAYFTSPEFISLLKFCQTFASQKMISPKAKNEKIQLGQNEENNEIFAFIPVAVNSYLMAGAFTKTMFNNDGALILPPGENGDKGSSFLSRFQIAINKKSKYQNEAWEFMKYLLSEEVQSQQALSGFPVNIKAQQIRKENDISFSKLKKLNFTNADLDKVDQLIGSLNRLSNTDDAIWKIINEELEPFFTGQKTAEETVRLIQSKVETYLNE